MKTFGKVPRKFKTQWQKKTAEQILLEAKKLID